MWKPVTLLLVLFALSASASSQSPSQTLDSFLSDVEAAQHHLIRGRPEPFKALWSQTADVTLTGGLGGAIEKGWDRVSGRLDWVASQYRDGTRTHVEMGRGVAQDFAYVVQKETIRFKGPDQTLQVQELRTTMVFRRENAHWRIVHRHADAANSKQPLR